MLKLLTLFILLILVSCSMIKKVENDFKSPEIMSAEETDFYMRNKLSENVALFRECLDSSPNREKNSVLVHYMIAGGKVTKSTASSDKLKKSELDCLSKKAGSIDFMMIKNYNGKQIIRF